MMLLFHYRTFTLINAHLHLSECEPLGLAVEDEWVRSPCLVLDDLIVHIRQVLEPAP
jgi:hypothetical protein